MVEMEVMGVDESEDKGERGEKRNEEHGDTVKVRVNTTFCNWPSNSTLLVTTKQNHTKIIHHCPYIRKLSRSNTKRSLGI